MQVRRMVGIGRRSMDCLVDLEDHELYLEAVAVWHGGRNVIGRVSETQLLKIENSVTSNEYYEWIRRKKRLAEIDQFTNERG